MAEEKKDSKLTRLALGGPEQLPGFTGNPDDYALINEVIFGAKKMEEKLFLMIESYGMESIKLSRHMSLINQTLF